jgi:hypothetical protein
MKHFVYTFILLVCTPFAAFAKAEPSSLIALSSAERSYYRQVFDYTMDNVEAGHKYEWKTYSGNGNIHVDEVFVSKSKVPCRNYSETFRVQNVPGAYQGVACKRIGADGWCRLKPSNAHTCAMEDPGFMFAMPSIGLPNTNIGKVGSPVPGSANFSSPNMPDVNMPNMNVERPKMPSQKKASNSFADSVTSGAGEAAGKAASGGFGWFFKTFGR